MILPLFALANTGVSIDSQAIAQLATANSAGIALGLIVGKPLGVIAMCLLAVACRVSSLPEGVRWSHIAGAGLLGGIGFTMSIFITNLAFAELGGAHRFLEARRVDGVTHRRSARTHLASDDGRKK